MVFVNEKENLDLSFVKIQCLGYWVSYGLDLIFVGLVDFLLFVSISQFVFIFSFIVTLMRTDATVDLKPKGQESCFDFVFVVVVVVGVCDYEEVLEFS